MPKAAAESDGWVTVHPEPERGPDAIEVVDLIGFLPPIDEPDFPPDLEEEEADKVDGLGLAFGEVFVRRRDDRFVFGWRRRVRS